MRLSEIDDLLVTRRLPASIVSTAICASALGIRLTGRNTVTARLPKIGIGSVTAVLLVVKQ